MFTACMMFLSCIITARCAINLIEVRKETGMTSLVEMGSKLYGSKGKIVTEVTLALSQSGFCCSYLYFLKENIHQVLLQAFGIDLSTEYLALIWMVVFILMSLVRKLQYFAKLHVFALFTVLLAVLIIFTYATFNLK